MNWHLFIDVMAWIWGVLFSLAVTGGLRWFHKHRNEDWDKDRVKTWVLSLLAASLCWAWIIAS